MLSGYNIILHIVQGLHTSQYIGSSTALPCGCNFSSWYPHDWQLNTCDKVDRVGELQFSHNKPDLLSTSEKPGVVQRGHELFNLCNNL